MMTSTRVALANQGGSVPRLQRIALRLLDAPRTLNSMSRALAVVQRLGLVPRRLGLGSLPVVQRRLIRKPGAGRTKGHANGLATPGAFDQQHLLLKMVSEYVAEGQFRPHAGFVCAESA